MKEFYSKPESELLTFATLDVVTTSDAGTPDPTDDNFVEFNPELAAGIY